MQGTEGRESRIKRWEKKKKVLKQEQDKREREGELGKQTWSRRCGMLASIGFEIPRCRYTPAPGFGKDGLGKNNRDKSGRRRITEENGEGESMQKFEGQRRTNARRWTLTDIRNPGGPDRCAAGLAARALNGQRYRALLRDKRFEKGMKSPLRGPRDLRKGWRAPSGDQEMMSPLGGPETKNGTENGGKMEKRENAKNKQVQE